MSSALGAGGAGQQRVEQLAAEAGALLGGAHVQLADLERVAQPVRAPARAERVDQRDLHPVVPPLPVRADVAVRDADQPAAGVARGDGAQARPVEVGGQDRAAAAGERRGTSIASA